MIFGTLLYYLKLIVLDDTEPIVTVQAILTLARNRGDLAEGWYDPATLEKAIDAANENKPQHLILTHGKSSLERNSRTQNNFPVVESDDEDAPGPSLPETFSGRLKSLQSTRAGPAVPRFRDLELRKGAPPLGTSIDILKYHLASSYGDTVTDSWTSTELAVEDTHIAGKATRDQRKADREQEKGRLEELVPRATAGTKERMLEKKREKSDANRAFAAGKHDSGGVAEVPELDLLGDEDGGLEGFKKQRNEMERKKNEREIRREEVMRAREAEREERVKQYREKEETTMKTLVELARARFG